YTDVEIRNADWRSIMIVCEGLRGAIRSLPLDLVRRDLAGARRGIVRIYNDEAAYHKAGGLPATVGTYRPRGGEVLIWTRGLQEPDPEQGAFRLSKARQYDLLVHELSHQATGREFRRMPTWFTEGVAEYLAAAHFAPGRYSFKDPAESIKIHVKKYLGDLAKQDRFGIVALRPLTSMDGRTWAENTRLGTGHGPFLKYVSAVLLLHYFCHLDPERNHGEVVRNFVAALRDGQPGSRAMVEQLLRGRGFEEIEEVIEEFWNAEGLRIEFRG
ncbi:MAG: hypothetical protein ACR2RV_29545, partial [Verrucomicrobiales bacterium]